MSTIRYLLLCCISFFLITGSLVAQTQAQKDSVSVIVLKDSLKKSAEHIKTLAAKIDSLTKPATCTDCTKSQLNKQQKFLVFTPLALLLLVTILFIIWIRSSKFTLADALSVAPTPQQYEEVSKARAAATAAAGAGGNTTNIPDPQPQPSVSRLLAFITGIIAIIIAVCLVSYHAYAMFAGCGSEAQFNALWKILLGLGIGVIPYGINVWNGNPKEQPTTKP